MLQEALICGQGLNDQDIQMLLALSEAMTCTDGLVPPEAVRLFKKVEFVKEWIMKSPKKYRTLQIFPIDLEFKVINVGSDTFGDPIFQKVFQN